MKSIAIEFGTKDGPKIIDTPLIKVRGKTIVMENTIYAIPNIAAIQVVDLSQRTPFPLISILLLFVAGLLLYQENMVYLFTRFDSDLSPRLLLSIGIIGISIFLLMRIGRYLKNRIVYNYGLFLLTNAGPAGSTVVESRNKEFLEEVAVVLYTIMNDDDYKDLNVNVDSRTITTVESSTGVVINNGALSGSVVNRIN
ncbi:hypothetical protein [Herpetosiphon gulosus]|uniref:Uncharacterized protein n=1 Tax=Herpetosiphon gulosus TaxID=1973496 RepID=A0ABP9X6Z5_9CHLR